MDGREERHNEFPFNCYPTDAELLQCLFSGIVLHRVPRQAFLTYCMGDGKEAEKDAHASRPKQRRLFVG